MTKLLSLRGISKSFGQLTVSDDVCFDMIAGEAVGVLGPNGAGKSTLFALIAGTLSPSSGRVEYAGRDVTQTKASERCRAGMGRSFQIPHPFHGLSVYENLLTAATFGMKDISDAEVRCADILRQTGLLPKANLPASALGLLDRKRLELARALATNPQLLLLDEIAGGLTRGECDALVDLIRQLHASGMAILWIEHVLHALTQVVERLIVIDRGAVIADGSPETVMNLQTVKEIYMGVEDHDQAAA